MRLLQCRGPRAIAGCLVTGSLWIGISGGAIRADELAQDPGAGAAVVVSSTAMNPFVVKAGRVAGQIIDATTQKPIPDVAVRISDALTNHTQARAVTDAQGTFSLADLEPGQYNLHLGKGVNGQLVVRAEGSDSKLLVKVSMITLGQSTPSVLSAQAPPEPAPAEVKQAGFQADPGVDASAAVVDSGPAVLPPAGEPVAPQPLPQSTLPPASAMPLTAPPAAQPRRFRPLTNWIRNHWAKRHADADSPVAVQP